MTGGAGPGPCTLDAAEAAIWPATQDLLAEDLAEAIAAGAAAADERGVLSAATVNRLRASGYFGLPVPAALQGGGCGLLRCAAAQRRLALADPALAIAVNMHLFSVGLAVEHWRRHRDSCGLILEMIASQRRVVASAFAEPGLGGALLRSTARARRSQGGYVVTGIKSPCSLAGQCDLVCFQMQAESSGPGGLMMAMIPSAAPGVRVERSWDGLGMRASGSDTLVLEECFVPDALIYHRAEPGHDEDEVFAAGLVWFCVATTATYLGVAKAALNHASGSLHRSVLLHLGVAHAALPSVQGRLGELVAATLPVELACVALADRIDREGQDPRSLLAAAVALKHAAVGACAAAVEGAAELVGGASFARTSPLARLWRDVQAARFHPPNRLASRQILGRWALGLRSGFELDDRLGPAGRGEAID